MREKITRCVARAAVLAAVLLTVGFCSSVANAQTDYRGKFTLTSQVQWGQAVLQPGSYLLMFTDDDGRVGLSILDANSQRTVAFEPVRIREDGGAGGSALLLGARGGKWIVYSLRIAELGEAFVYDPALAHPRVTEEANKTRAVPVLVAKR